jgi:predicted MFS family arabinose efflux permease
MPTSRAPSKIFYGWIVVGVAALVMLFSAGVRSAPGVFLVPIETETLWKREVISRAVAFGLFVFGFAAPFSGQFMDRFGPKRVVLIGLVVIAISMATSAMMTEVWQMNLLWGALSGIGTGLIGSVLGATVANRWFLEKRGLVTGIFGAATSAGFLVFAPLLQNITSNLGWRNASWVLAALPLVLILPIVLLLKDNPSDVNEKPYGAPADFVKAQAAQAETGVMHSAVRSLTFWLLAITFFICGFTSNGLIGTHFIPYAISCGIPAGTAANTLAMMGMFNFVGTIASGWLTDRYDPRKLLGIYYAFRGLSLILLPFVSGTFGLTVFAVMFGLDYIATVPPTIKLCADSFGRKNVGTVYGWVFCAHQVGAAVASWFGGFAYDQLGNYVIAFVLAGVVGICAALLALQINRQKRHVVFQS